MRSVEEQQALLARTSIDPAPVRIAITEALGLMCAEEVVASEPLPCFPQAAIDGYAVRSGDTGEFTETREGLGAVSSEPARSLPVVGEIPAGSQQPLRLQPKQAMRVEAGAPLPALADAVLPYDWSDRGEKRVTPLRPVAEGEFVRQIGDDIAPGDVAVRQGTVLGPAQIGLLASVGRDKVLVYPRPRMSVISYGHELVDIDRHPGHGQVFDVDSYALAAAGRDAGADVHRVGIAVGEPRKLRDIIESQLMRSEMLVIAGGVGGHASELLREVLAEFGPVDVARVAMHPGSIIGICLADGKPIFLLPSNPVGSLALFEVFIRPLIRRSMGKPDRRVVKARALNRIESRPGRRGYVRGSLMRDAQTFDYLVEGLSGATGAPAHLLAGLGEANAMIRIPEDVELIRPGDVVDVIFLSSRN
ncbi:MAG: molybdopterin molybdotransferase MoeA [Corynebacterium sp.]|nr:molybdopterin molybdotransferase MoeA [Corynebacterium sp.]